VEKRKKRESLCERNRSNRKGDKRVKKTSTREKEQKDDGSTDRERLLPAGWNKFQEKIQEKILERQIDLVARAKI